jgi:hypothetical protein
MAPSLEIKNVTADLSTGSLILTFNQEVQILDVNAAFYPDQHEEILCASGLIAPTAQRIFSDLLHQGKALWVGFVADQRSTVQIGVVVPGAREISGLIERLTPVINNMYVQTSNLEIGTIEALKEVFAKNHELTTWNNAVSEMAQFLETHFKLAFNALLTIR